MKIDKKQFDQLIEKSREDKKSLILLKEVAVRSQLYDLAAKLKASENELFPKTEEEKEAESISQEANLLLRMVDINTSKEVAYKISKAFELFVKMKGKFSIKEAAKITEDSKRLFED